MNILNLTDDNIKEMIANNKGNLIIYWYDNKKRSSQIFEHIMVELSKKIDSSTNICKINIEEKTSIKYGVMCLPTTMYFKEKTLSKKIAGIRTCDEFLKMLK